MTVGGRRVTDDEPVKSNEATRWTMRRGLGKTKTKIRAAGRPDVFLSGKWKINTASKRVDGVERNREGKRERERKKDRTGGAVEEKKE